MKVFGEPHQAFYVKRNVNGPQMTKLKRAADFVDEFLWGRHREREWVWAAAIIVCIVAALVLERLRP